MVIRSSPLYRKGTLLLLLTTVIWGTSFPVLKDTISVVPPPLLVSIRFGIAAIALLPWLQEVNPRLVKDGALLGGILFLETMCALTGLETISANRSAFIIGLNVILVPLLGTVVGKPIQRRILIATGIAVCGVSIMSWEGGGVSLGDMLTVTSAIGVAVYILLLEAIAPRHSSLPLTAVQTWIIFCLGLCWCFSTNWAVPTGVFQPGTFLTLFDEGIHLGDRLPALIYLGIVVTVAPLWIQAMGQRWIPAHDAALLYTLEPIFAAAFSFCFLGETMQVNGFIGAALILLATVMSQSRAHLPNLGNS